MSTYKSVWEKYSKVQLRREVFYKRLNADGTYEASFTKLSSIFVNATPIDGLSRGISNTSWKFGAVTVGAAAFKVLNPYQNFSSEEFAGSIFSGFIRDRSQIKLIDYLHDPDLDANTDGITVFQGVIDGDIVPYLKAQAEITWSIASGVGRRSAILDMEEVQSVILK